jgi:hypothetical protein
MGQKLCFPSAPAGAIQQKLKLIHMNETAIIYKKRKTARKHMSGY